jgi:hypothetical protein
LQAKAFDKKTSVLHYVAKLVNKNDSTLLTFSGDLGSVRAAENIILDGLNSDVSSLGDDLLGVHETIKKEADRLEQAGELRPMTLADLAEQRTVVKQVGSVPQYNKTDHLTGRTSMERFSVNAKVACEEAADSISDVKKKYAALVQYFDEDEQIATSDFFGTFRRFIVEWGKAVEQVEAIEKKEVSWFHFWFCCSREALTVTFALQISGEREKESRCKSCQRSETCCRKSRKTF